LKKTVTDNCQLYLSHTKIIFKTIK